MMVKEIGSHFEFDYSIGNSQRGNVSWLPSFWDSHFTFSGRSAIELAIKDIQLERKVKKVYMPSYCCKSMIEPFIEHDIEVEFYEVFFDAEKGIQYSIDSNVECDIFFAITYFGIEEFQHDSLLKRFQKRGIIIIEDITHRLLNKDTHSLYADYAIASLRKWFPIATGGLVAKNKGQLHFVPNIKSDSLIKEKVQAMKQKTEYLNGKDIDKTIFLITMAKFEKEFKIRDYRYKIDSFSLDVLKNIEIDEIRKKRRNNAQVLYEGIKNLNRIKLLIPSPILAHTTPLFLPIMIENGLRDSLRHYLIEHCIYCPVHWPNTKKNSSSISNGEMSLVCDQRYSEEDMNNLIEIIEQWDAHIEEQQ